MAFILTTFHGSSLAPSVRYELLEVLEADKFIICKGFIALFDECLWTIGKVMNRCNRAVFKAQRNGNFVIFNSVRYRLANLRRGHICNRMTDKETHKINKMASFANDTSAALQAVMSPMTGGYSARIDNTYKAFWFANLIQQVFHLN